LSLSIRDQLLNVGLLKPGEARSKKSPPARHAAAPPLKPADSAELTLEKAYQARVTEEKRLIAEKKQQAEQKALEKRDRKHKALALIAGQSRNLPQATELRYFSYSGKIRSIYVSSEQRAAINTAALGIVQMDGRFHLVDANIAEQIREIAPEFIALYGLALEPEPSPGNEYADPKYQVPDDLIW